MVTLYLAGTSIRLESKITVGERMLERYKKFKEKMPKEFSISRTRRGCFAYLNQRYTGSNVVAQAENLEDENGKIIARLATLSTIETINEEKDARDLLFQKQKTNPCNECVSINCKLDTHAQELIRDIQNKKWSEQDEQKSADWSEEDENRFNNLILLVKYSDENGPTKKGFIDFINRLKSTRHQKQWKPSDEQMKALSTVINLNHICALEEAELRNLLEQLSNYK